MAPRVWFITGCSSGFGQEFALEALRRGDKVIATARNEAKLQSLKQAGAATLGLDVTASREELNKIAAQALEIYGRIDILLNNAGFVWVGGVEESSYEEHLNSFQTNVFGPLNLSSAFLPAMRAQKSGTIIFMSSIAAYDSVASIGAYSASKAALSMYGLALRDEVEPFGIKVGVLEPGMFQSSLLNPSNMQMPKTVVPEYENTKLRHMENHWRQENNNQCGNVQKGVKLMVDIITETGAAEGRDLPRRLGIGSDGYTSIKTPCQAMIDTMDEWHDIIVTTDRDDYKGE